MELVLKLSGKDDDCRFNIDCVTMRKALDWAAERRDALAERQENNECTSPEGCFITTACCDVLGLDDDCFELRTLRRYRDDVLAKQPGGAALIAPLLCIGAGHSGTASCCLGRSGPDPALHLCPPSSCPRRSPQGSASTRWPTVSMCGC